MLNTAGDPQGSFEVTLEWIIQMPRIWLAVIALSLISACSTAEYDQAYDACSLVGNSKYPVTKKKRTCRGFRNIEVPTGKTECVTEERYGKFVTSCEEITETRGEWYDYSCVKDVNYTARTDWILQCAANACFRTFGNVSCKTD